MPLSNFLIWLDEQIRVEACKFWHCKATNIVTIGNARRWSVVFDALVALIPCNLLYLSDVST